jgi:hypothetical protein
MRTFDKSGKIVNSKPVDYKSHVEHLGADWHGRH